VPIAKTRLSDFLGQIGEVRAEQGASTYLSGSIEDAQAKFNLQSGLYANAGFADHQRAAD
jgi:general secretion pathway protein K